MENILTVQSKPPLMRNLPLSVTASAYNYRNGIIKEHAQEWDNGNETLGEVRR